MHAAEAAQNEPYPRTPPGTYDSSKGNMSEDQKRAAQAHKEAYSAVRDRKRAALPVFDIAISSPSSGALQVSESGRVSFTATLTYTKGPPVLDDSDEAARGCPVVLFLHPDGAAPLGKQGLKYEQYQVHSQPDCGPESRVRYQPHLNITMRRPRGKDGRFLDSEPRKVDISPEVHWVEMKVGDSISREMELGLLDSPVPEVTLEKGKEYWLQYAPLNQVPYSKAHVEHWAFGTFEDWNDKQLEIGHTTTWLPIPVPKSNAIPFVF